MMFWLECAPTMWIDSLEPTSGPAACADIGGKKFGRRDPHDQGHIADIIAALSTILIGGRP
ncbi:MULTISPECIES: hypothetical protein [unclassified Azospirillum]|uniref:hypothetical protein n=1 Tax=unclassified Azospirillum TaxID=2630922 RepID=UPI0011780CF2|nr:MULTISPECIES: hypothetical protein [unclassified Azospirillum]